MKYAGIVIDKDVWDDRSCYLIDTHSWDDGTFLDRDWSKYDSATTYYRYIICLDEYTIRDRKKLKFWDRPKFYQYSVMTWIFMQIITMAMLAGAVHYGYIRPLRFIRRRTGNENFNKIR